MKLVGSCACFLVALDCAGRATGYEPQSLFAQGAVWSWWVLVAVWVVYGVTFWFWKPEGQA